MLRITILLAALAALVLASCSDSTGPGAFDHLIDFTSSSGNTGYTEEHITDKPRAQFHFDVTAVGVGDAIEPENVKVEVTLACKTGPSYQRTFEVELKQSGSQQLEGSFDRSAPECIDPVTGQNGIAVWQIEVTRLSPQFNFNVHFTGFLN